jgi:hypothetical protein
MKRLLVFVLFVILISGCSGSRGSQAASQQAQPEAKQPSAPAVSDEAQPAAKQAAPAAELSFIFSRRSGSASNQFAVWIEDHQGKYIKTLYATRYTANGGWRRRATSIPMWVRQSGLADMTQPQIDTMSGATPRDGELSYVWDGTDMHGNIVPAGEYVMILEGTLRWSNQVYYRAPIILGQGAMTPRLAIEYIGDVGDDREMISEVRVRTLR